MEELCKTLMSHIILDFDGDVTYDTIDDFLADDPSPLAQSLRGRLDKENGAADFLLVLSDCLRESLRSGITPARVEQQIKIYVDS